MKHDRETNHRGCGGERRDGEACRCACRCGGERNGAVGNDVTKGAVDSKAGGRAGEAGSIPTASEDAANVEKRAPEAKAIDRVIRWCVVCFVLSSLILGGVAWHAVSVGKVGAYLNLAGIVYVLLSTFFLVVIAWVFVQGHLGSSREIEAPKLDIFDIERRR
jgi:hypothetical protein